MLNYYTPYNIHSKCSQEALEDSRSEECLAKTTRSHNPKNKLILINTTNSWRYKKLLPPIKFVRPSEKRHLKNILIKEETPINSKLLLMHMKFYQTQRKGNSMISMDSRASKMEDHQVGLASIYLTCSTGKKVALKKEKLN